MLDCSAVRITKLQKIALADGSVMMNSFGWTTKPGVRSCAHHVIEILGAVANCAGPWGGFVS